MALIIAEQVSFEYEKGAIMSVFPDDPEFGNRNFPGKEEIHALSSFIPAIVGLRYGKHSIDEVKKMKDYKVLKGLGMICLLAGIVRMGMTPAALVWGTDSPQELTFGFIACILMAVGTIAGFLAQSKETSMLGFLSTLGMAIGNVLTAALVFIVFVKDPAAPLPEGPVVGITRIVSMLGLLVGTPVFAIMTLRAKVFPRWVAVLFIINIVSMFLPVADNVYFAFFWGLAYASLGFCIVTGRMTPRSVQEEQTSASSQSAIIS
ncbi:hypothetical protein [Paenibacillus eucommiae]|uniref:Uncharacterized protein n=1 Tax=Paenibacillus eucommiae TaxID=1355755 RepID=A0ABS4J4D2_9BACL|nr:hypothetical protein [Paenibacillus eucommiae]MBP1994698.1 hypothetical protein [Paenibacillus eucommiae]